jgi:MFS transporter, MHS family, proline/betaine transporter
MTDAGAGEQNSVTARPWSVRRTITAGVIGNVLEWYDFAVYGFFAPVLAQQFFPSGSRAVSLLAAFGAFAVGFLMRPVGALVFGYIGDRYGRAKALIFSIALMAGPTFLMGLLPTYQSIGIAASILIVLLRMAQGIAVGGEFTSSIVFLAERAPQGRRGFYASWAMFAATSGTMLGSAIGGALTNFLGDEQVAAWGWRAAFMTGIIVGLVGFMIRRGMEDTPRRKHEESPLKIAFRDHKHEVIRVMGLNMSAATTYYLLFVYVATWIAETNAAARSVALNITTLSIVTFLVVAPIAAWISDRYGRKLMLIVGMASCLIFAYPLLHLMHQPDPKSIIAGQMIFAGLLALYMASIPAAMCEMFPHDVRVTAVSVGYGLAYAIFGGTAPAVAVWLIGSSGNDLAFAWYIVVVTIISLAIALTVRDRRNEPL